MSLPCEAQQALSSIQKRLGSSLVAVYLHGSAVSGGLRPHSDIDLLVIVNQPLTPQARQGLAADLLKRSGHYPFDAAGRRPLEVIVLLQSDLAAAVYPARCEFMYGEWLRHDIESGKALDPVTDSELSLVLAQARQEAIALAGPEMNALVPAMPRSVIHQAIQEVLPALLASLEGDERNVVLTLARMWRTLVTEEFVSKDIAAHWAAARLPEEQAMILKKARVAYLTVCEEDWQNCQLELERTITALHHHVLSNL